MTTGKVERVADHDRDRYPTATKLLQRAAQAENLPDGPVEWIEIHALANGEASVRVRPPRSDDVDGAFIPAP